MESRIIRKYYADAQPILMAVDCIIFGFDSNRLKLLLFKRKLEPFKDEWSLVGSFVDPQESLHAAADRILSAFTGLQDIFMEPLSCYGEVDRDPGARVISQTWFALIRLGTTEMKTVASYQARWFDLDEIPELKLDHNKMVDDALVELRQRARYRPIGFELLPEAFTLPQLQALYESIFDRELDRRNFRKKIIGMNILEKLDVKDHTGSKKGAWLYKFNIDEYPKLSERRIDF